MRIRRRTLEASKISQHKSDKKVLKNQFRDFCFSCFFLIPGVGKRDLCSQKILSQSDLWCKGVSFERQKQANRPKDKKCVLFLGADKNGERVPGLSVFSGFESGSIRIIANLEAQFKNEFERGAALVYRNRVFITGGSSGSAVLRRVRKFQIYLINLRF